ncbi:hypothetical protein O4220_18000 [Rhodococcus ruber]|uniref:Uncharacterized protein n=1 Tax=Rhodococcus ruber TaxID=1830 RepID=A0ABT4MHD8_9NOCA|nr:hypothetical protein [Rhodococcus ruber]MCZ4520410.1 hypothetical protein [Rhodococcus ruber]
MSQLRPSRGRRSWDKSIAPPDCVRLLKSVSPGFSPGSIEEPSEVELSSCCSAVAGPATEIVGASGT